MMNTALPIQALATGDENAYRVIYDHFYYKVFSICMRYLGDRDKALDCLQDVFTSLWVMREQFCKADDFQYYLFQSAVNKALLYLRKEKRRYAIANQYVRLKNYIDTGDYFTEIDLRERVDMVIEDVLKKTSKAQRDIYYYSRTMNMPLAKIAEKMGIRIESVYNAIFLVQKRLRERLEPILKTY